MNDVLCERREPPKWDSDGDEISTAYTICLHYYLLNVEPEYHHYTTVVSFDHINRPSLAMRHFHHIDTSFFRTFSASR